MTLLAATVWIVTRQATYGYAFGLVGAVMIGTFARSKNLRGGVYIAVALIMGVIQQIAPSPDGGFARWADIGVPASLMGYGLTRLGWEDDDDDVASRVPMLAASLSIGLLFVWIFALRTFGNVVLLQPLMILTYLTGLKLSELAKLTLWWPRLVMLLLVIVNFAVNDPPLTRQMYAPLVPLLWFVSGSRLVPTLGALGCLLLGLAVRRKDPAAARLVWFLGAIFYVNALFLILIMRR